MHFSSAIWIITAAVLLLVCLGVFIYLQIYKKNINRALHEDTQKAKPMLAPYKLVFVLIVFLVSFAVALTGVSGLIYAKNYFKYEKDTAENLAGRTVFVDYSFEKDNLRGVKAADTENIKQILTKKYPHRNINVIPLYRICGGIYLNQEPIQLYAVPKTDCALLGLSKMQDRTAYFYNQKIGQADFEISVTEITEHGFESDKLEHLTFQAENSVSENGLIALMQKDMSPQMREMPLCFVTMESLYEIASVLLETEITAETDLEPYRELIVLDGIYICSDNLGAVSGIASTLVQENYNAYAPVDTFGDFEETVSNTYIVFILSSVGLVCLSAVNIYLTVRTVKRIKKKEE